VDWVEAVVDGVAVETERGDRKDRGQPGGELADEVDDVHRDGEAHGGCRRHRCA
jgi:hypothetical protein